MPKLSLVVPIYNEARHLERLVQALFQSACPIEREWIFVDDGSTDGSLEIVKALAERFPIKLLEQELNRGKGAAVIRGLREATGDYVMIQDADFEYDPNDIPRLLEPLLTDNADVVSGSRFRLGTAQASRTYYYYGNRFLTTLSNLLSGIHLTDVETCYKIFRREIICAMNLRSRRFGTDIELIAYLGKIRTRVVELPVSYSPRSHLQGKKIGWKDGAAALWHLAHFNLFTSRGEAFTALPERYSPKKAE